MATSGIATKGILQMCPIHLHLHCAAYFNNVFRTKKVLIKSKFGYSLNNVLIKLLILFNIDNTTWCVTFDRWLGSLVLWNVVSAEVGVIL